MTEELIQLNEDEFNEQFPLVHNHLNPSAGWVYISENDADQRGFEKHQKVHDLGPGLVRKLAS